MSGNSKNDGFIGAPWSSRRMKMGTAMMALVGAVGYFSIVPELKRHIEFVELQQASEVVIPDCVRPGGKVAFHGHAPTCSVSEIKQLNSLGL